MTAAGSTAVRVDRQHDVQLEVAGGTAKAMVASLPITWAQTIERLRDDQHHRPA